MPNSSLNINHKARDVRPQKLVRNFKWKVTNRVINRCGRRYKMDERRVISYSWQPTERMIWITWNWSNFIFGSEYWDDLKFVSFFQNTSFNHIVKECWRETIKSSFCIFSRVFCFSGNLTSIVILTNCRKIIMQGNNEDLFWNVVSTLLHCISDFRVFNRAFCFSFDTPPKKMKVEMKSFQPTWLSHRQVLIPN